MSVVLKFGGTSLLNASAFKNVGNIIKNTSSPLVILSAINGVTDQLERLFSFSNKDCAMKKQVATIYLKHAEIMDGLMINSEMQQKIKTLLDNKLDMKTGLLNHVIRYPNHKETQYIKENIMATGEQISCIIMNHYLKEQGVATTIVEGDKIFMCDHIINPYPQDISVQKIKRYINPIINKGIVPLITGYYGRDKHENIVTFGKNGSDLTATFIADALGINLVQIYKVEVNKLQTKWEEGYVGVVDEMGNTIPEILFDEALTIAQTGRNVLSYSMLRPLINNKNLVVEIKNTLHPELAGTKIIRKL